MLRVEPFKSEDLIEILKRNRSDGKEVSGVTWEQMVLAYTSPGSVAFTVKCINVPIVCCGIVNMQWRRGEAWIVLSGLFMKYKFSVMKLLKRNLEKVAMSGHFIRVQSTSLSDDRDRYFRFLGFEKEGTLKGYGPNNEDVGMYSLIIKAAENV